MRDQTHKLILPHQLKRCLKGAAKEQLNLKTKLNKKLIRLNKQRKKRIQGCTRGGANTYNTGQLLHQTTQTQLATH